MPTGAVFVVHLTVLFMPHLFSPHMTDLLSSMLSQSCSPGFRQKCNEFTQYDLVLCRCNVLPGRDSYGLGPWGHDDRTGLVQSS
jgi:hypothetical protein